MADPIIPSLILEPEAAVAWAATFVLHSTLLIGSIWLLTRLLGMKAMAVQDRLWKVALFGALFSCTVQAGLGDGAIAPRINISPVSSPAVTSSVSPIIIAAADDPLDPRPGALSTAPGRAGGVSPGGAVRASVRRLFPVRWQRLILLCWGLGAAGFTGGLLLQLLKLKSRFRGRYELTSGPEYGIFRELVSTRYKGGRAIRLTVSDRIPIPVACGIRRPEICLPRSMVGGTAPEQLKSVLAHELAHIVRRDQVWLLTARLAESIFFFQPLVRLARRCFQETAEFICDGEAVRQTGKRVPLARSLHEMARRRISTPTALTIPGISGKGSPLNRRIEMILDKNRPAAADGRARWFGPLAAALILVFAFFAPGVTAYDDPPPRPEELQPAEAPPAPEVPDLERVVVHRAPEVPEPADPPAAPRRIVVQDPEEPDEELSEAEEEAMAELEAEMAEQEAEMAETEREMAAEAEAMHQLELEMAEQEAEMAEAEREMAAEAEAMQRLELEMAEQEAEMAAAERELAEQEEELIREIEALREQEEELEEAGDAGDGSREEVRVREKEIHRRHEEIRERHREISREHREISRQHRDVARRQVEDLRQRRAVFHSQEAALRAQRRGLERAIHQLDKSLAGELTGEQRQSLDAIKLDLEEKLRELEEDDESGSVPLPEELEPPAESL